MILRFVHIAIVCLLSLVLTGLLYATVLSRPDVYSGRVTVAVLAPPTVDRSTLQRADAVLLASLAVIEMNDTPHRLVSNSTRTTMYGHASFSAFDSPRP